MVSKNRREFIKKSTLALGALPFIGFSKNDFFLDNESLNSELSVNIFSKHLQFLDYKATGEMAAEMGFSGVDLTVRPKGHILPENVKTDLPKAINDIRYGGSKCDMITTNIESVNNPLDVDIIKTAAQYGIKYYRTNWYKYPKEQSMEDAVLFYQKEIENLGRLNKELGIIGYYQNRSGQKYIGTSFWEIHSLLNTVDTDFFGLLYDIKHATLEGGYSWENGLRLLQDHIKLIVLKDFRWEKVNGVWKDVRVPIGEGMVNFDKYFKLLKKYKLKPPVSLHFEYPLGGAEYGNREISVDKKVVFDAMKRDLSTVQKLWLEA